MHSTNLPGMYMILGKETLMLYGPNLLQLRAKCTKCQELIVQVRNPPLGVQPELDLPRNV